MGRHSASLQTLPADVEPRKKRPFWLRTPVIPATAVVLTVVTAVGGVHVLGSSGSAAAAHADQQVDLSALATGALSTGGSSDNRVSRNSRSTTTTTQQLDSAAAAGTPSALGAGTTAEARTTYPVASWVVPLAPGAKYVWNSCFCMRWGVMHDGIDLAAPLGTPILAVGDGVVLEAGPEPGFGHWILIQHANGDVSVYGHMYSVEVKAGQPVHAGDEIAKVGADGNSTGPHLHFGIMQGKKSGPYIDPIPWLASRGISVGTYNGAG